MFAIMKKEIKSYFYSPVAYVLIGFFILLSSLFFQANLQDGTSSFTSNIATMGFILIFITPILTMRILAEDRKNGTEVLLITSPASITSIVIGKYLAAFSVFLVITVLSFVYPLILLIFGGSITAELIGAYFGFILLGASFISVGIFASSITENQIIAAIVSFASLLIMWVADGLTSTVGGFAAQVLGWISLITRYNEFTRGVLGLSATVYYLSFAALFLFLAVRVIERRRWSQG